MIKFICWFLFFVSGLTLWSLLIKRTGLLDKAENEMNMLFKNRNNDNDVHL